MTHIWHKKVTPQFLFLQIKGHYEVKKKKKLKQQNCLALMIITIYIWFI